MAFTKEQTDLLLYALPVAGMYCQWRWKILDKLLSYFQPASPSLASTPPTAPVVTANAAVTLPTPVASPVSSPAALLAQELVEKAKSKAEEDVIAKMKALSPVSST